MERNGEAAPGDTRVKTSLTSENGQKLCPLTMFETSSLTVSSERPVDIPHGRTGKTTNVGTAIRQVP